MAKILDSIKTSKTCSAYSKTFLATGSSITLALCLHIGNKANLKRIKEKKMKLLRQKNVIQLIVSSKTWDLNMKKT